MSKYPVVKIRTDKGQPVGNGMRVWIDDREVTDTVRAVRVGIAAGMANSVTITFLAHVDAEVPVREVEFEAAE